MRIQSDGGEPKVLEQPPDDVVEELRALRTSLDDAVPPKRLDHNLLIATWNVRAFGGLTEKWQTAEGDSPKRNVADVRAIAEILSRFDVIAIQEARSDLKALRHTLKVLGPEWGLILTDTTRGRAGNDEGLPSFSTSVASGRLAWRASWSSPTSSSRRTRSRKGHSSASSPVRRTQ